MLAPSKRPMHTLIPAMALRDGEPWLVFGIDGRRRAGRRCTCSCSAHVLDDGVDPADAIDAPALARSTPAAGRLHARVALRRRAASTASRARGHDVTATAAYDSGMGHAHAIWRHGRWLRRDIRSASEGAALGL